MLIDLAIAFGRVAFVMLFVLNVAALLLASQAVADPSPTIAAKEAEAQQVVAEIDQLNVSLDRSNELVNLANLKLAEVRHEIDVNRRELVIARSTLRDQDADTRLPKPGGEGLAGDATRLAGSYWR